MASPAITSVSSGLSALPRYNNHSSFRADQGRRTGNYGSNFWDFDFLQTLEWSMTEEEGMWRNAKTLKEVVRSMLKNEKSAASLPRLELVNTVERLGLKYLFETEIMETLLDVFGESGGSWFSESLYSTSLGFRLFREHGMFVSQDVFKKFTDDEGKFKAELCGDVNGLLSLYEASFLGHEGDGLVEEAAAFAACNLKRYLEEGETRQCLKLSRLVEHSLDLPLRWRLPRIEARWFIDVYGEDDDSKNPTLHDLAILEFNRLQAHHRREIGRLARWWVEMGLDRLNFGRNCLVESYMFCHGMAFEAQYSRVREVATQIVALITTIDDIYDTYGSIGELELFTDFARRWDVSEIDRLPHNIKLCFFAMYNNCNDIGYAIMKERGYNVIPYLSKAWADLLDSYLREARWYHEGYTPTLEEYMDNALVSIGVHPVILSNYFLTAPLLTKESLEFVDSLPPLLRTTDMIFRFLNDMGTSSYELARGDTLKAVQCYMHHTGASEGTTREHITGLVRRLWKEVNGYALNNAGGFPESFIGANINSIRAAQFFYQNGDGYGAEPENLTRHHLLSLLFNPIHDK